MHGLLRLSPRLRGVLVGNSALLLASLMMATAGAGEPPLNKTDDNVAINGYDTVAYFTDGQATKGSAEHEALWQDARWRFASDDHRRLFAADPSRYAPQFGGWCAGGVAAGEFYAVDPETWTVVDGKLYLSFNRKARDRWENNRSENIAKAERVWAEHTKRN